MPTKVNIVLDDDVRTEFYRLVASGKRSRVVNAALRREMLIIRREQADRRLESLRKSTKRVSTSEIVKAIRRDRGRQCPALSSCRMRLSC